MSSLVYEQTKISVPKNINISCSPNLIILTDFPLQYNKLVFDVSPHGITGIVSNLSQVRNRRRSLQVIAGRRRLSQVAAGRHRLSQDFADPSRSQQVLVGCHRSLQPGRRFRRKSSQVLQPAAVHGVFCPEQDLFDSLTFDQTINQVLGMALFLKGIIYDV